MKLATPGVKLTYDDFVRFPDDGKRHELIDGEHYVTPSPNLRHQHLLGNLYFAIRTWSATRPLGRAYLAPFDVVFSDIDVVQPDLLYLSHERAVQALTPLNVRGVPELVVEIASKGTRKHDETVKRRLYERSGVSEYWVVDPVIEVVRVYRLADGAFARPAEHSRERGDILTTPLLPGFELPLSVVFAE